MIRLKDHRGIAIYVGEDGTFYAENSNGDRVSDESLRAVEDHIDYWTTFQLPFVDVRDGAAHVVLALREWLEQQAGVRPMAHANIEERMA